MQTEILKTAQYVLKHPVLAEGEEYKENYIRLLEYFVKKYSYQDIYSNRLLELYKRKLLSEPEDYQYDERNLKQIAKKIVGWKFKGFRILSYRYCLLADIIVICSYLDNDKSQEIYQELRSVYHKRHWQRLDNLFDYIVGVSSDYEPLDQMDYISECLELNKQFLARKEKKILVTANMSAGKSTLINALIGKKINKTQNLACTAKTHYILNKSFEDTLSYEYDHELELDADTTVLMENHESNETNEIYVGTRFRSAKEINQSICLIDTPGVNSALNPLHREISEHEILSGDYDMILYVLNAENIGTDDDQRHLKFIHENYKGKVVFVVNKLDQYREDDSIVETLDDIRKNLENIGFHNPIVCPISARSAYLAKLNFYGEQLEGHDQRMLEYVCLQSEYKEYHFNSYYGNEFEEYECDDRDIQLLHYSGIMALEKILYGE